MEAKHTPGNWTVSRSSDYFDGGATVVRRDEGPSLVVAVLTRLEEEHANANLIAAAPDLLEALRRMLKTHDPFDTTDEMEAAREAARAAIAKAEGE